MPQKRMGLLAASYAAKGKQSSALTWWFQTPNKCIRLVNERPVSALLLTQFKKKLCNSYQLSSSTAPIYVRSVLLTLTVPLSQLDAFRLAWSPPPTKGELLDEWLDPAPSSKRIHGSTSWSFSCCDDTCLAFPATLVAVRSNEPGFLWVWFDPLEECNTDTGLLGSRELRAAGNTDGGWQDIDNRAEGKSIGMAHWMRHLTVSGSCIRSKSFCTNQENNETPSCNLSTNIHHSQPKNGQLVK